MHTALALLGKNMKTTCFNTRVYLLDFEIWQPIYAKCAASKLHLYVFRVCVCYEEMDVDFMIAAFPEILLAPPFKHYHLSLP